MKSIYTPPPDWEYPSLEEIKKVIDKARPLKNIEEKLCIYRSTINRWVNGTVKMNYATWIVLNLIADKKLGKVLEIIQENTP